MNNIEIRSQFLNFFESKKHQIVPSAPIVVKNDPTLMFTNAGMNQFKDWFLGNQVPTFERVANTQKCLRVSGKHNDLEEVGVDHYHHTMFEMLGNWSFGNYFKQEAIDWAWELLTEVYKLDKERMYVTVFEGDSTESLAYDKESFEIWAKHIPVERILNGNKKDNFWEMGDTGPCGPCSEIHFDMRSDKERKEIDGKFLVNNDHPEVIEIWNLVFMEFNRKADSSLVALPNKHVDTGMGFERLTRVIQDKKSNYDTDIFTPIIQQISEISKLPYNGSAEKKDIAFRVIADHIRTIIFAIADGQLPSSNGAGYVIRRILRRAVRYGYSFLGIEKPFLFLLVKPVAESFKNVFQEASKQVGFIEKVVMEEEASFLKTLERGLELLKNEISKNKESIISGKIAFELYDTFGFPVDLTRLIASENNKSIDEKEFESLLNDQKNRSRADAQKETGDWFFIGEEKETCFEGYDKTIVDCKIVKYRVQKQKGKEVFQLVFDFTPFYPEGGGQVGDTGFILGHENNEKIKIDYTSKENNLILHNVETLPANLEQVFSAQVDTNKRDDSSKNHSATHLLHAALRNILGTHVAQKGSLVNAEYLRFDFSHFAKLTDLEIAQIEELVNTKINAAIPLEENRSIDFDKAVEEGAMALFGEKYSDKVRMITFGKDYSIELCGGTHVRNTSQIGVFKILNETAVAAGVRRIEAITSNKVLEYYKRQENTLKDILEILYNPKDVVLALQKIKEENLQLRIKLEEFETKELFNIKTILKSKFKSKGKGVYIVENIEVPSAESLKNLCFQLKNEVLDSFGVIGTSINNKPMLAVFVSDTMLEYANASKWIKELAPMIKGGGGGQVFYANAGGTDIQGLQIALQHAEQSIHLDNIPK